MDTHPALPCCCAPPPLFYNIFSNNNHSYHTSSFSLFVIAGRHGCLPGRRTAEKSVSHLPSIKEREGWWVWVRSSRVSLTSFFFPGGNRGLTTMIPPSYPPQPRHPSFLSSRPLSAPTPWALHNCLLTRLDFP